MELSNAIPYAFRFRPESTALVIIDMQRDFLESGGFGSIQCGDANVFNTVRKIVPVVQRALEASRRLDFMRCISERDISRISRICPRQNV
jgi:nicotinamidase-related amidase